MVREKSKPYTSGKSWLGLEMERERERNMKLKLAFGMEKQEHKA